MRPKSDRFAFSFWAKPAEPLRRTRIQIPASLLLRGQKNCRLEMLFAAAHESVRGRFCCKSRLRRIGPLGLSFRAAEFTRWPRRSLRNSDDPQRTCEQRIWKANQSLPE